MVADPETCRLNGSKSKGPKTERGKAISSRNATKHGLLAQQPPLLATEDLSTFEGLVQGLIDHYQPENPVEHFLVQQIAMGMLKQYRLWTVEAAIANIEVLKTKLITEFPDHVQPPKNPLELLMDYRETMETRTPFKNLLRKEKGILEGLIADLEHDLAHAQENKETKTLEAVIDSMGNNYYHEDRNAAVWQYQDELDEWLSESWNAGKKRYLVDFQDVLNRVQHLIDLANQRLMEISPTLNEIKAIEHAIEQAEITKEGIQQPELFSRYQTTINRQLYDAIERLEAMQERKNAGSMGSFGRNADPHS